MHSIYGLRLKGDTEFRYIGKTRGDPAERLKQHRSHSRNRTTPLADWINANEGQIEAVDLARCDHFCENRVEAAVIASHLERGDRLLNTIHVKVPAK